MNCNPLQHWRHMRGLSPEAMVLEEIRQQKLVNPEEYLLIQKYIQTRTDHSSASQIKDLHQSWQSGEITEVTYLDTKAKLITRIRKEVKTREISPVVQEEVVMKKPAPRVPFLLFPLLAVAFFGLGFTGIFTPKPTESAQFLESILKRPSGSYPMESFRQPDGTFKFDYPNTRLGESTHLVWYSPEKWWFHIEKPAIEATDLGKGRALDGGLTVVDTRFGNLFVEEGSTGLHIRSEMFQKAFSGQ